MKTRFLARLLAALAIVAAGFAQAAWPEKPIKIIVPFPAGGASDATARALGQTLARRLAQPVLIDNRPGANGGIAAQAVMVAPADGYTILWATGSMVALPQLMKTPPFASLGELTAVASVGRLPFCVFVHPDLGARTLADLVAIARGKPGSLNYATGSLSEYLAAAQLQKAARIAMERVPYKGGAALMPDLVAGRVQVNIGPASTGMTYVNGGRLRVLATLLPARSSLLPDVPTAAEAGFPDVKVPTWQALFAPPRTSREIANRLSQAVAEALADPAMLAQFERIGVQPAGSTPEGLEAMIREDQPAWVRFIRENGIEAE